MPPNNSQQTSNLAEPSLSLSAVLAVARRRLPALIITTAVCLLITLAVTFGLPSVYESSATILIEQQEVPPELVRSTVTSYADQRIQVISQRVMTSANLLEIVNKYELYSEERATQPTESVLERLRDNITLEMVSADVIDPRSGRPTQATIAFKVVFEDGQPVVAQRIANELASLYLNENLRTRRQAAAETSTFLAAQARRLGEDVATLETQLAAFKEDNSGALPELVQLNMQLMDRTDRELLEVDAELRSQEQHRIFLESQLAETTPTLEQFEQPIIGHDGRRLLSTADQLLALQTQYVSLTAVYGEQHPDVIRTSKELNALRSTVGGDDSIRQLEATYELTLSEFRTAREKYSDEHPDVKRLLRLSESLERQVAAAPREAKSSTHTKAPANPAYVELAARLSAISAETITSKQRRAELLAKLDMYRIRLERSPQVERNYRTLARDYENALSKYQEVRAKQMEAELAETLESEQKGEHFTLIEPPQLPSSPAKPNRLSIGILGVIVAVIGGVSSVGFREALDTTIRGETNLTRVLGQAPLASISRIDNAADKSRRMLKRIVLWSFVLLCFAAALSAIHYFFVPLDVLWYGALNRGIN